jgi:hypothetical protein
MKRELQFEWFGFDTFCFSSSESTPYLRLITPQKPRWGCFGCFEFQKAQNPTLGFYIGAVAGLTAITVRIFSCGYCLDNWGVVRCFKR